MIFRHEHRKKYKVSILIIFGALITSQAPVKAATIKEASFANSVLQSIYILPELTIDVKDSVVTSLNFTSSKKGVIKQARNMCMMARKSNGEQLLYEFITEKYNNMQAAIDSYPDNQDFLLGVFASDIIIVSLAAGPGGFCPKYNNTVVNAIDRWAST